MSRKIPNIGLRSAKVLNGCATILGEMDCPEAMAQLTRLRTKVKAASCRAFIGKTMQSAAVRRGVPLADLEELAVPTFGMDAGGSLRQGVGAYVAEMRITSPSTVELTWRNDAGKVQRSVPTEVRRDHGESLATLTRTVREIGKALPVQRERLEQLLLAERVIPYDAWRARYVDHPVVGPCARRLIWHFADGQRTGLGAWRDGAIVGVDDRALDWIGAATRVRLWHPIGFEIETIRAWRAWLERHQVVQPFKQAHREVYIITDAELTTRTYSNRFAAHILRQHQFAALCKTRGWRYALQGNAFDNANIPTLTLAGRGLTAQYFVEPCPDDGRIGVAAHVSTDQVRFLDESGAVQELAEIPALVFSEVMRDVDLFVGVASVGTDPAWIDNGRRPEWNHYWREFAFGDLTQSAETRREALAQLLPRLKIASRCHIEGKFLHVRGDRRTYKIHLGSSNILMEPNDQYLCIVADPRGRKDHAWVPFEGDTTLSVILSKAFLLAADTTITDPTILRQLG